MTVVSNIHLNIAGWANTTYVAGARVSNASNAYQCTTPGMSTAPPTGTGSGINNGGTAVWEYLSGIDYTTMQAWVDDTVRFPTAVTQPMLAVPWNSGNGPVVATLGTPILTLSGHTGTSSGNTITIQPPAGESFQAVFQAAPTTPYAYNPANGVAFQLPPAISIVTAGSGGSFTDGNGHVWTINTSVNSGEAYQDGRAPAFSGNVTQIALIGGVVWQNNIAGQWYYWSGTQWLAGPGPSPIPVLPTATVYAGSGGSFTDASSNVWTINSANNGEVYENGSAPAFSSNVTQIDLVGGVVWQLNSSGFWYYWSGSAWTPGASAPVIATNYFQINDNYVRLVGLQFQSPIATTGGSIIGGSGANLTISQCIIDGFAQAIGASPIAISGANLTITNSLIFGRNATAGGAMVTTLGATGAAIANNTFVHTSPVSGQAALDAGSNTSTSTETSINNIFYNYATVYICAGSGTPWLTSYCFYSAASFSGSNKGTDAGNSVYNLTAAIFLAFPTNMNPASGSALINAGFTDTTDIPAAADAFGTSRPQGTAWDGGAVEMRATTNVVRDFPASFEFKQSMPAIPNDDPIFGIEWRHGKTFDVTAPIDWATSTGSSIGGDAQIPLEILHGKSTDLGSPVEWLGSVVATTSTTRDAAIGLEWRSAVNADAMASGEVLQSMPSILSPWAQAFGPVFGIGPYSTDPSFAIEWSAGTGGAFGANITAPLEWRAAVQRTVTAPSESGALLFRDVTALSDWGAGLAFIVNASFAIDWRASFTADTNAPVGWLQALATPVDIAVGLELRSSQIIDAPSGVDWRASLQADSAGSVDWTQPVTAGRAIAPIEFGRSVIADSPSQVATLANIQRESTALMEWGRLFPSVSFVIPAEFTSGILGAAANGPVPVDWTASLSVSGISPMAAASSLAADGRLSVELLRGAQATAVVPIEPGGGVDGTIGSPLEFGHLTFTIMVDGTIPLEINSLVVGSIVVPVEPSAVHLTLGAALTPDTWEWQHQPEKGGQLP